MLPVSKVQNLISKHSQLEKELSSGDIDKKKFVEKSREYSVLNEIIKEVKAYIDFVKNKKELDDGSFDTQDVNTHQKESLLLTLQNRANCMTEGSSQSEALNVFGPLNTIQKMNGMNNLKSIVNRITQIGRASCRERV